MVLADCLCTTTHELRTVWHQIKRSILQCCELLRLTGPISSSTIQHVVESTACKYKQHNSSDDAANGTTMHHLSCSFRECTARCWESWRAEANKRDVVQPECGLIAHRRDDKRMRRVCQPLGRQERIIIYGRKFPCYDERYRLTSIDTPLQGYSCIVNDTKR